MATKIIMPKLGFDMSSGKVVRWLHKVGEAVRKGEPVLEIETDKATVEVNADADGILASILVQEGDVPVGEAIGEIVSPGESASTSGAVSAKAADETPASPATEPVVPATKTPAAPGLVEASADDGRVPASPLARRMAREMGIALTQVKGSGPGGRVVKEDVEAFRVTRVGSPAAPALAVAPAVKAAAPKPIQGREVPFTRMRQTIARRMSESKGPVPQFYLTTEVEMDAAMRLVSDMLESGKAEDLRVSPLTLVMKACANMLRKYPSLNGSFGGDRIILHEHVNLGVAVAVDGGLLTPVIPDCEAKSVAQIARETRAAAERARSGKLSAVDLTQGTFSISNLGMFEIEHFVAIVNPPEAAILAIGTAREVPVVAGGHIETGWRMKMTLSADHRVTDGAEAARFLQEVKRSLQSPMGLFL